MHVCVYIGSSSVIIFTDKQLCNCISQDQLACHFRLQLCHVQTVGNAGSVP